MSEHDPIRCDTSPLLTGLCHGLTHRCGGVSSGPWASLNLAFGEDDTLAVLENRRRLCQTLGVSPLAWTEGDQEGDCHMTYVGEYEKGRGAGSREDRLAHCDILLTDRPGILLTVLVQDDVPVIYYDPVHHACAVAHMTWQGSLHKGAVRVLWAMDLLFGTKRHDVRAYIGAGAGFHYGLSKRLADSVCGLGTAYQSAIRMEAGAFYGDLALTQQLLLQEGGLEAAQIDRSDGNTYSDMSYFSYRRDGGHTGSMAAFAMIRSF